jgi:hypothetical protein
MGIHRIIRKIDSNIVVSLCAPSGNNVRNHTKAWVNAYLIKSSSDPIDRGERSLQKDNASGTIRLEGRGGGDTGTR